jgi:Resolvase, N terminal domain
LGWGSNVQVFVPARWDGCARARPTWRIRALGMGDRRRKASSHRSRKCPCGPAYDRASAGLDCGRRPHHGTGMNELLVGYARVSTEQQDLTTQRDGLHALGVGGDRIYVDHGLTARTGTGRVFGWRSPRVERATPSCDETGPAHTLAARCPRLCRGRADPGGAWPGLASASAALPRSRPLALATYIPSRVRSQIRSASHSATMSSTLNRCRPTGSVGS